jgi:hypothetical protein
MRSALEKAGETEQALTTMTESNAEMQQRLRKLEDVEKDVETYSAQVATLEAEIVSVRDADSKTPMIHDACSSLRFSFPRRVLVLSPLKAYQAPYPHHVARRTISLPTRRANPDYRPARQMPTRQRCAGTTTSSRSSRRRTRGSATTRGIFRRRSSCSRR